MGLGIDWTEVGGDFFQSLEEWKRRAAGTTGIPFSPRNRLLISPSGKPPTFAFQLQHPNWQLFLSRREMPKNRNPNGYLCLNSQHLWREWLPGALHEPVDVIEDLGGAVLNARPSRVDLCADFHIPGGLDYQFLKGHQCPSHLKGRTESNGQRLETFYVGARRSPIQCRIYDKGAEIVSGGTKFWFQDIWEVGTVQDVWRVEFQLRRPMLKAYRVNSIADLIEALPGLWKKLTEEWLTLRLRDADSNISRCELHPFWQAVQQAGEAFGECKPLEREPKKSTASVEWYVSQISGLFGSYAVRRQLPDLDVALHACNAEIRRYWSFKDWRQAYFINSVKSGLDPGSILQETSDEQSPDFQI